VWFFCDACLLACDPKGNGPERKHKNNLVRSSNAVCTLFACIGTSSAIVRSPVCNKRSWWKAGGGRNYNRTDK
jgi:hypothetical protein